MKEEYIKQVNKLQKRFDAIPLDSYLIIDTDIPDKIQQLSLDINEMPDDADITYSDISIRLLLLEFNIKSVENPFSFKKWLNNVACGVKRLWKRFVK